MKLGSGLVSLKEATVHSRRFFVIGVGFAVIVFAGAAVLSGCGGEQECSREAYQDKVKSLVERWGDVMDTASSTPRMTLAIPLETMRGIRRETKDLSVEACAKDAHEGLIEHMDAAIDAYNAFMAQEDESLVTFTQERLGPWSI
jgi:hypothetical protein